MIIEDFTVTHFMSNPHLLSVMEVWTDKDHGEIINQMLQVGTFRVIRNSSEILVVAGFIPKHQGVCEVVMFPSMAFLKQYFTVCKILRAAVYELMQRYRRIEMVALDNEASHRFAEFLGFEQEGILRQYNNRGEDYIMYSIVGGIWRKQH